MAYCEVTDLLTGNVPVPANLNPTKFVSDAADEIDSQIGFNYETPVSLDSLERPASLLLKRINVWLATGRLLMAADSGGEDTHLHQYGEYLVREASAALKAIADGSILLTGATLTPTPDNEVALKVLISNKDATSNVDDFYDKILMPDVIFYPEPSFSPAFRMIREDL